MKDMGTQLHANRCSHASATAAGSVHCLLASLCADRSIASPPPTSTDMTANWPEDLRDRLNPFPAFGLFGLVEEAAGAVTFLASDEASFIRGQT
jgi:NAD(P)-dependent dehydrogenase (short-subunit alcohol dehydrogenase family)